MKSYHLQIVTPAGLAYDGEAEKIIVRTIGGDVCILAKHADYATALGMGEARVVLAGGENRRAACIGGLLTVTKDQVRIVAATFEWAEDIDVERARRSKEEAEKALSQKLDEHEQKAMQAKLKRALVRIKVCE